MKIQEQIDDLRGINVIHGPLRSWTIARCDEFADTLERLNAVYEAANFVVARYTGGCETYTSPSTCITSGRLRDAKYGADQWCDACVLSDAIDKLQEEGE